jgi:hypothetical protein
VSTIHPGRATLGALDQRQLGALFEHAAACGRIVVLNESACFDCWKGGWVRGSADERRDAGGCHGQAQGVAGHELLPAVSSAGLVK